MGMFDPPEFPDWLEQQLFAEGVFKLESLTLANRIKTQHGEQTIVLARVNGTDYACTGVGFENQARNVKPGDLPAHVSITRVPTKTPGQFVKRFTPGAPVQGEGAGWGTAGQQAPDPVTGN